MKKVLFTVFALAALVLVSCSEKKSAENNPFMSEYENEYGIPPFDKITYADYEPAVDAGIEQQNAEIDSIIKNTAEPNFENTILALDNSGRILDKVSRVFNALSSSDNTPEMQKLSEVLLPKLTAQSDGMYMNDGLFAKVKAVYDNADKLGMDPIQKRLTEKYYKEFVRNGALLTAAQKDSLKAINTKLGEYKLKFGNNVMHDMDNCVFFIDKEEDLKGLPQGIIDNAAKLAADKGKKGQWAFTATASTRLAVLTYADSRDLRRKMYETYTTTASHGDKWDNTENIRNILLLRQQKANLLGFNTYADYAVGAIFNSGVSDDLFNKMKERVSSQHESALQTNEYWMQALKQRALGIDIIGGYDALFPTLTVDLLNNYIAALRPHTRLRIVMN